MYCNIIPYIIIVFSTGILIGIFIPAGFLVWVLSILLILAGIIFINS